MKTTETKPAAYAVQFYSDDSWLTEKWFKDQDKAVAYAEQSEKLHGFKFRVEPDNSDWCVKHFNNGSQESLDLKFVP